MSALPRGLLFKDTSLEGSNDPKPATVQRPSEWQSIGDILPKVLAEIALNQTRGGK